MKLASITVILSLVAVAEARDWAPRKIPKIEGEVVEAIWKGAHSFKLMTIQDDDGVIDENDKWETTVTSSSSWFVILKNVAGMNAESIGDVSRKFALAEPSCPALSATIIEGSGDLLLRFEGDQSLLLRKGQKVRLSDCTITIDILGASMSYGKLEVLPTAATDSDKTEQGAPRQPATPPRVED